MALGYIRILCLEDKQGEPGGGIGKPSLARKCHNDTSHQYAQDLRNQTNEWLGINAWRTLGLLTFMN